MLIIAGHIGFVLRGPHYLALGQQVLQPFPLQRHEPLGVP